MNSFKEIITTWYQANKRDLPWRNTNSAYKIWLSEIILQQTRVEQGMAYYLKFIANYPKIEDLARADIDDVLRLWQGLGYYSRARNLHFTAQEIVNKYNGKFPENYRDISNLKGIGDYTAAAISSFAFNEVQPVLDGNVFRVMARFYGINDDIAKGSSRKVFKAKLQQEIDQKDPATFNQAIMEFGALQCTPKKPNCNLCPLNQQCYAFCHSLIDQLPVKSKNIKIKKRYFNYIVLKCKNKFCLIKRKNKDIWQGLFQFHLHETKNDLEIETLIPTYKEYGIIKFESYEPLKKHILSHQHIFAKMLLIEVTKELNDTFYTLDEIDDLPKPILIENFLVNHLYQNANR